MSLLRETNTPILDYLKEQFGGKTSPVDVVFDRFESGAIAYVGEIKMITAGTHNYLGLAQHPKCIEAAIQATRHSGTGTCGSRIANGTLSSHVKLEQQLSDLYGKEYCVTFSTGFMANLGVISSLVSSGDYLFIDADSHASIYDATKATDCTSIRFRHNNAEDLDKRLSRLPPEAERATKLVVVEGVYSMLGDVAPLKEILAVTKKHGAYLLVDEAHSMGVYGDTGAGVAEMMGLLDQVDFVVGTFSKSMGALGGYCVTSDQSAKMLRVNSRPYMFSASLPPATIASVSEALRLSSTDSAYREKLWKNINTFHGALTAAGIECAAEPSPIVAIVVPSIEVLGAAWSSVFDDGYYVNVGAPPATPNGLALLRCAISASHESDQLKGMAACIISALQNEKELVAP